MSLRGGLTAALFAATLAALAVPANAQGYHIGALLPNSGPMTQFGQLFSNGANLAADHINADKLLSKPFHLKDLVMEVDRIFQTEDQHGRL